jgi:hypothetical protein
MPESVRCESLEPDRARVRTKCLAMSPVNIPGLYSTHMFQYQFCIFDATASVKQEQSGDCEVLMPKWAYSTTMSVAEAVDVFGSCPLIDGHLLLSDVMPKS